MIRSLYLSCVSTPEIHRRVSEELGPIAKGTTANLISSLKAEFREALAAVSDPLESASEFAAMLMADRERAIAGGDVRAALAAAKDLATLRGVSLRTPVVPVELTMPLANLDGDALALLRLALEAALQTTGDDHE